METYTKEKKEEAMKKLLAELEKGLRSAEEHGWISEADFRKKFFGEESE